MCNKKLRCATIHAFGDMGWMRGVIWQTPANGIVGLLGPIKIVGPLLHDPATIVVKRCSIVGLLYIATLGVCQLRFQYIDIHTESFSPDRAKHAPETVRRVFSLKSHFPQCFAQCISM